MPAPPTRSKSRRVIPNSRSQRSLPGCPGMMSMTCVSFVIRAHWCRDSSLMVEQNAGLLIKAQARSWANVRRAFSNCLALSSTSLTQPFELGIRRQRATGFGQRVAKLSSLASTGNGSFAAGHGLAALLQLRVEIAVVCKEFGLLLVGSLVGGHGQNGGDVRRQSSTGIGRGALVTEMRNRPSVCWPSEKFWTMRIVRIPGPAMLSCVSKTAVCDWPVFGHDGPAFVGRLVQRGLHVVAVWLKSAWAFSSVMRRVLLRLLERMPLDDELGEDEVAVGGPAGAFRRASGRRSVLRASFRSHSADRFWATNI